MTPFLAFYRKLAVVQTILTGILGTGCVLIAGLLLDFFGMTNDASGVLLMRAFGAGVLWVAMIHWFTRGTNEVAVARGVCLGNVLEDGLLCVLSTLATLNGTLHWTGWLLAATFGGEVLVNLYALSLIKRG
ncbi:MAG: hypothetical protein AAGE52_17690 [Myxococcota bacterium]